MDLNGKCVLLGVSGGIAAYKMANVASALRKLGADVEVIMTKNATQFITPLTFETLTGHKCMVDTFDRDFKFEVTHISLAKKADVLITGDIGHHEGIDAVAQGLAIIDGGHYGIEHIFIEDMRQYLEKNLKDVEVIAAPIIHPFLLV